MTNMSFSRSKRHNVVEVAITYVGVNDRHSIASEIAMLHDLSRLMDNAQVLHRHGNTPVVPTVVWESTSLYTATIDLKFPIKPSTRCHIELYAVLYEILNICNRYRGEFMNFSPKLNLAAMTAPWVLPVADIGVILRRGSKQVMYTRDSFAPIGFIEGTRFVRTDAMCVVGEPLAVKEFCKRWDRVKNDDRTLDIDSMQQHYPKLPWHNLAVFVREAGNDKWHLQSAGVDANYARWCQMAGNDMLTKPMGYDNDQREGTRNIFLNDHEYYEFSKLLE